jgi:hypothetical protein
MLMMAYLIKGTLSAFERPETVFANSMATSQANRQSIFGKLFRTYWTN